MRLQNRLPDRSLFVPNVTRILLHQRASRHSVSLLALLALGACGERAPVPGGADAPGVGDALPHVVDAAPPGERYERLFAFVSAEADSALVAPWEFFTERRGAADLHERWLRLGRPATWEQLALDVDTTGPVPGPARILPGRRIRVLVGENGAIEALELRDPIRAVTLDIGIPLAQWSGPGAEGVRFHRALLQMADTTASGFLLDLNRAWQDPAQERGDWIFVQGGDGFQLALSEAAEIARSPDMTRFRGWGRIAGREMQWGALRADWREVMAFERARRDVPVVWEIATSDDELHGTLEVVSSHLRAGEGEGPLLPVDAFHLVRGSFAFEGDTFEVTGIARHRRR
jgi:hypothetical protein